MIDYNIQAKSFWKKLVNTVGRDIVTEDRTVIENEEELKLLVMQFSLL